MRYFVFLILNMTKRTRTTCNQHTMHDAKRAHENYVFLCIFAYNFLLSRKRTDVGPSKKMRVTTQGVCVLFVCRVCVWYCGVRGKLFLSFLLFLRAFSNSLLFVALCCFLGGGKHFSFFHIL